ncbi:MAG: tetratricopeptide repeat protein [Chloroflexota bacterium]|nr:tetratricopeptide repeat protein [Chloroflexota bacterium]
MSQVKQSQPGNELASRNVRYQPYSDQDQNSAPLLDFLKRHITALDPNFQAPHDEWTEKTEDSDWDNVRVSSCGTNQGYRVAYNQTYEPRAMGIAVSGVTVEAFGLPAGHEFWIKCERYWYDPRYLELRVSGPEQAVQVIADGFAEEFGPNQEQPLSETQVRIELVSAESSLRARAWPAAEMRARSVLKWQPDNLDAAFILGTALLAQKKYSEGEELLRRAVAGNDQHVDAWYNLGNVMLETGTPSEAELYYLKALALSPNNHPAFYTLGVALEQLGVPDEALEAYRQALRTAPNPGQVAHYTGLDFEVKAEESIARLEAEGTAANVSYSPNKDTGQALAPELADIVLETAQHYSHAARWIPAERRARAVLEARPEEVEARRILGTALYVQNKLAEAEEHFRKVLETQPNNYRVLFNLGGVCLKQDRAQEALEFFSRARQATQSASDKHAVHYVTARALEKLGRVEEARSAYQEVLAAVPSSGKSFKVEAEEALKRLDQPPSNVKQIAQEAAGNANTPNPPS